MLSHDPNLNARVWAPTNPDVLKPDDTRNGIDWSFDTWHEPICATCRYCEDMSDMDNQVHGPDEAVCKRRVTIHRKKPTWPIVDVINDGCGDHALRADLFCGDPGCPICTATKGGATVAPVSRGTLPVPALKPRQREMIAAYEVIADLMECATVPLDYVRDMFKDRHHVDDPDPERANKKRLDAWSYALKDLPPGFVVDKAGRTIARHVQ